MRGPRDALQQHLSRPRTVIAIAAAMIGCVCLVLTRFPVLAAGASGGEKNAKSNVAAAAEKAAPKMTPLPVPDTTVPLARQYCTAVEDQAAEARYAWQTAQLEQLAKQVEERLAKLEERAAALKEWMSKRDAFTKQASDHVVAIFTGMRPESASEQLVRLNPGAAAAILSKLEQRAASAILNDMPADKAARITSILTDAARTSDRDGER